MILEVTNTDESKKQFTNMFNKGNVIVLFYANWCGYCQMMKPAWNSFKEKCANDSKYKNINIAEVESEFIEDVKMGEEAEGYPTIKFYKTKSQPIKYEGDRTDVDFLDFASNHSIDTTNNNKTMNKKNNNNKNSNNKKQKKPKRSTKKNKRKLKKTKKIVKKN